MKRIVLLTLGLLAAFLIACGGGSDVFNPPGSGGNPPPAAARRVFGSYVFGQQAWRKPAAAASASGFGIVHAQALATVALAQGFHGICNFSPGVSTEEIHGILFGVGQNAQQNCTSSWFTGDPALAAASATQGQVIIGNGTMTALTCWATEGSNMPGTVRVRLWVNRPGSGILDTGLNCPLTGAGYQKNQVTGTFQALDGDRAILTYTKPPSDNFVDLHAVFDKQ